MMKWICRVIVVLIVSQAHFLAAQLFDVKPVTDDVYAAIAKPTFRTNCNAAIFILSREVVVVDAESKPSAAREVIAQIKRLTDKPVTHLVITHLHGDHFQGAEAYVNAWPAVQIISTQATRDGIESRGVTRMQRELVTVPLAIEKFNTDLAKTSDDAEKVKIQQQLHEAQAYLAELKQMKAALPNVTFDRHLTIHSDNDTLEVLFVGKGHSDGDVFVYDPKRKVIATGDSLTGWVPTMGDASIYDWMQQLKTIEDLDFKYVIGGHGSVLQGKDTFDLWRKYFADLLDETSKAAAQGASLEETKTQLIPTLLQRYGTQFPPDFSKTVIANVETAYRVMTTQTK
jgi:glyoxylase-like metal-dependent hydrolase (beta-lactamase superfamily II)